MFHEVDRCVRRTGTSTSFRRTRISGSSSSSGSAATCSIEYRPVLFAGLLNHWGQRGPAEIPGKRTWTYRWCTWYAAQRGIPFKLPQAHPFNPLGYLRLAIAANCEPTAIRRIFERLWTTGVDASDARVLEELATSLGIARERARGAASQGKPAHEHGRGDRSRCVRRADAGHRRRSVLGRGRDGLRARVHRGSQRARQRRDEESVGAAGGRV